MRRSGALALGRAATGSSAHPPSPQRADSAETRESLVRAVTGLLAQRGRDFSLADAAARAGTSTATAYRQLVTKETAIELTCNAWIEHLCAAIATATGRRTGISRLRTVCRIWVESALEWGPAAVYVRSPRGVLQRLHDGDHVVTTLWKTLTPVIEDCIERRKLPDQDPALAFLTWCSLFDERNIVDLSDAGWAPERISTELTNALLRALGAPTARRRRGVTDARVEGARGALVEQTQGAPG